MIASRKVVGGREYRWVKNAGCKAGGYWRDVEKVREANRRYEQSEKGREKRREANRRYKQSEKGREVHRKAERRYDRKRRNSVIPLDAPALDVYDARVAGHQTRLMREDKISRRIYKLAKLAESEGASPAERETAARMASVLRTRRIASA